MPMGDRDGSDRVRYRFSPLERRGVIAGWRGGQIASVATGLVAGVLALRSRPTLSGVAVAVVTVAVAVAVAFWPVQGRTGEQWLPLLVRRVPALTPGGRRQLSPAPRSGHVLSPDPPGPGREVAPAVGRGPKRTSARPTTFAGLDVVGTAAGGDRPTPSMGMVIDRPARTATAVIAVRGHSFALLGHGDQDAAIAAWARVLTSMAREGSDVHRVQWVESCVPDDGGAVRQHQADHGVLGPDSAAGRSYRSLLDESSPTTRRHCVLLALSVHTSRSSRAIRAAGGGRAGIGAVLGREIVSLERALDATDVTVDGVLGPRALGRVITAASSPATGPWDPDGGGHLHRNGADGAPREPWSDGDPASGWPWPMAVEPHWDAVRTDGTWHATYWIAEWPRVDVTPDFLGPLLFSPLRRTLTVVMEPVSPSRAARQVAQARTADIADGELRRRGGFLVTARHTREKQGAEDRDVELSDGHAQYRFSGYLTVTADSRDELRGARAAVEQAAGQARVELRLLYGEQDVAFACSLPLGRGLA